MLGAFKRLFSRREADRDLHALAEWARVEGHGFKRARGDLGFVVDGTVEGHAWRMEWGPPQRAYIQGHELRLRMELDLPADLQMLVLTRGLMEALERQVFEDFTDPVQTEIGAGTPEEMRWLVMYPKADLSALGPVKTHFGAVANVAVTALGWIEGALAASLSQALKAGVGADLPLVLMTLRGRLYLRTELAEPTVAAVSQSLKLFLVAATQARRVAGASGDAGTETTTDAPTAGTTAWQTIHPRGTSGPDSMR